LSAEDAKKKAQTIMVSNISNIQGMNFGNKPNEINKNDKSKLI